MKPPAAWQAKMPMAPQRSDNTLFCLMNHLIGKSLLLAATFVLSACGGAVSPSPTPGIVPPTQVPATLTAAPQPAVTDGMAGMTATDKQTPYDAQFIDGMIAHHQGAVDMAKDALNQAKHPELKAMAMTIIDAQNAEIQQMRAWRDAWFPGLADTGGTGMSMGMMFVAPGNELYDIRFIDAMIPHHQGAIAMAEALKSMTQRAELLKLADQIISAQTAEVALMKEWRATWMPAAASSGPMIQVPSMAMVMGKELVINRVQSPGDGWIVIHSASGANGEAGAVLGFAPVKAGVGNDVVVELSDVAPELVAMLHVDKGAVGVFEFPGADEPLLVDGKPVVSPFATMVH